MSRRNITLIGGLAAAVILLPLILITVVTGGFEDDANDLCGPTAIAGISTTDSDQTAAAVATIYSRYAAGITPDPKPESEWNRYIPKIVVALQAAQSAGFTGESLITIVAIAGRESHYDPNVLNDNAGTDDLSYGLWQINVLGTLGPPIRRALGLTDDTQLWDPATNARAARLLYQSSAEPFRPWGPYKHVPALHGGAADWVPAVYAVAVEFGFIGPAGEPVTETPDIPDEIIAAAQLDSPLTAESNGCELGGGLQGADCTGLRGSATSYLGVPNGQLTRSMFEPSDWGLLQPAAADAWSRLVDAAVEAGFDRSNLAGWNGGPGARAGNYSNHTSGLALDVDSLAWVPPFRTVPGEPLPVSIAFESPLYQWLRANAHLYGWCNPAWARPLYLNGTATGGRDAAGNGHHLEAWHWEYVAGSTSYLDPDTRGRNSTLGLPATQQEPADA